ncbi:replicative helicase loader/inhibitor [uncultured Dysosmobacter sp.]|uniref:replicative helicase loader/inhibitor n=1 Tax=uncultured Dysosmobacter sp. TaxID=2591384 RepID=UPI00263252BD|nr:replicative helicase loader/inhibitor [uncultured Dysosmobacter sp.]
MTAAETGTIMNILQAAYPRFYADISKANERKIVLLWAEMFANDDVSLVAAAVKALIETDEKGFPPHIGAVKAKLRLLTVGDEMSEAEAWSMVASAIRNGTYGAKAEFEKFPPIIRRIVGSPNTLREWAGMDSETVHSVVASNFQRSYRAISEREREFKKLPPDVKELVLSLRCAQSEPAVPEKKTDVSQLPPPKREIPAWMAEPAEKPVQRSREEVIAMLRSGKPSREEKRCNGD